MVHAVDATEWGHRPSALASKSPHAASSSLPEPSPQTHTTLLPTPSSPSTSAPLLTVADIYELSRVDAIINLQRWWKHRRHHNHQRITELRDQLRTYAESLIQKKRQARIRAKIRDIVLHMVFLYVYTISCHRGYSHEHLYRLVSTTTKEYKSRVFDAQGTLNGKVFDSIASPSDLYAWLRGPFLSVSYPSASEWESASASESSSYHLQEMLLTNYVIGGIRIGQLRVPQVNCTSRVTNYFPSAMESGDSWQDPNHALFCFGFEQGDFDPDNECTTTIMTATPAAIPFAGMNGTDTAAERRQFFSSMVSSNGWTLPSPAFSMILSRGNSTQAREELHMLAQNNYIDRHTRAVMVDVNLYNAMLQYILAIRFLIEFPSSGGAIATLHVSTAPLTKSFLTATDDWFWSACSIAVLVFYLYFLISELALHANRRRRRLTLPNGSSSTGRALRWSSRNGSGIRLLSLTLYVLVWLMRLFTLLKLPTTFPLFSSASNTSSNTYIRLRPFAEAFRVSQYLLGVNTCLCWYVLILLLRVLTHVDLFVRTMEIASMRLLTLLLCLSLLVYGYASAFLITVGAQSAGFRSIPQAMATLMLLLFGSSSSTTTTTGYSTMEIILLACFLLLNVLVISNLFLVVIWESYRRAVDDIDRLPNANDQFNLPLETFLYSRDVARSMRDAAKKLYEKLLPERPPASSVITKNARNKRLSVVHAAISSSHMVMKSKRLIAGPVGALSGLGDKFVRNVAAGLGDHDLLMDADAATAHSNSHHNGGSGTGRDTSRPSARGDFSTHAPRQRNRRRDGVGGHGYSHSGGSDHQTKLLQGMLLQLAMQNEQLQHSMEEVKKQLAKQQQHQQRGGGGGGITSDDGDDEPRTSSSSKIFHTYTTSGSTSSGSLRAKGNGNGLMTTRAPSSRTLSIRRNRVLALNQPENDDDDDAEDDADDDDADEGNLVAVASSVDVTAM